MSAPTGKLKSTHQKLELPPLPPGWTEHKAPTGHSYYYNAATKQSTYKRPEALPAPPPAPAATEPTGYPSSAFPGGPFPGAPPHQQPFQFQSQGRGGHHSHGSRRPQPQDRPKHKDAIPGCEPWVLVRTKLKRRFVHNPETGESFWKFPDRVMKGVIELDRIQRKRKERRERGDPSEDEEEIVKEMIPEAKADKDDDEAADAAQDDELASDEEYEEVEVTDEEEDEESRAKRQRTEEAQAQPMEMTEDDIAYQLAAMGEGDYDMDDYAEEGQDWDEGNDEDLTEEDSIALFQDMLDDHAINPFTTWETIIERGDIIEDPRYVALPNMKSRRDAFSNWSRDRMQKLQEARARQEKADPKIPYLALLHAHATPKLYWPEFKRKFRKEPAMKDMKLPDKEREKLYREHIARLKLPQRQREDDIIALLKDQPISALNRSSNTSSLPPTILANIKFISVPADARDRLVEKHISKLDPAPEGTNLSAEDEKAVAEKKRDRERREHALRQREQKVEAEKRRQQRDLGYSKGRLRDEEMELERAMRVGKEGLKAQLADDEMKE
jgi:hypothetical protein